jgi:hypothetical protein
MTPWHTLLALVFAALIAGAVLLIVRLTRRGR